MRPRLHLTVILCAASLGLGCRRRRVQSATVSEAPTMVPAPIAPPTTTPAPPSPTGSSGPIEVTADWATNATTYRGQAGRTIRVLCPPAGTAGNVWGTDVYTDDSSICTAAVHTGRIALASGGVVTLRVQAPLPAYTGSARFGVTSMAYGSYGGSFDFVGGASPAPPVPGAPPGAVPVPWSGNLMAYRGQVGRVVTVFCTPSGTAGSVWGTDVYTDDSSVCTAAVHAGRITLLGGGVASAQIEAGISAYTGLARNGITSNSYGTHPGSFSFVGGPRPAQIAGPPGSTLLTWDDDATRWRSGGPAVVQVYCPPGGHAGSVWGVDVYSDDSSICTAAVHAGRITMARGGAFTLVIGGPQPTFSGSLRNGVASSTFGSFPGSFVVR